MNKFVLGLMLGLAVVGCRSVESKAQGTWEQQSLSNNIFANMGSAGKGRLELKPDHTFALQTSTFKPNPKDPAHAENIGLTITGTYKIEDKAIEFSTQLVNGKPIDEYRKELEAQMSDLSNVPGVDTSQVPPDQMAAARDIVSGMSKDIGKHLVPVLQNGTFSDSIRTLNINCDGGVKLEFGKMLSTD